jgi:GWxTD domain-containing protein
MRVRSCDFRALVLGTGLLAGLATSGQEQSGTPGGAPVALSKKEIRKQEKKLTHELGPAYQEWLREDVVYIITKQEYDAFLQLSTNEERDQFIETFFDRRNPNPESAENSFKDEHYRRIAYANEHFASGVPGWRTDRGRIYIIWGAPDELEAHPTGGTYDRPMTEGGGSTTTHAYEKWRYRHLEGVGENVELEFVDPSGSGEYHLTMDPGEKDALAHVSGAGASESEILGLSTRAQRFSNSNGTTLPAPLGASTFNPFDNLEKYFKVQQAPRFQDLAAMVSSRIVRDQMHVDCQTDFIRVTDDSVLVPITVQVANRELSFENHQGVQSAALDIYARISSPTGRVVGTFEESVSNDFPESLFALSLERSSIYQKAVPLRPGLYRLDVVAKDVRSGKIGTVSTALRVPRYETDKIDGSSLIVADEIAPLPTTQVGAGQFVLGSYKVRPRIHQEFSNGDKMGVFLQVYNLKTDSESHKNSVAIEYRVMRERQEIWKAAESSEQLHQTGEQITLERLVPVASLAPGRYLLVVTARDLLSGETLERQTEFTLKVAAGQKNNAAAQAAHP